MKKFYITLFLMGYLGTNAQSLRVYFSDKGLVPETITSADVELSPKAIERRLKQNIDLDIKDIAVNHNYIQAIENLGGEIKAKSRWFNYVVAENISEEDLASLPFVKFIESPKKYQLNFAETGLTVMQTSAIDYGQAQTQIEMVRGHIIHDLGFQGQGMTIAVLDGGFTGTDTGLAFDSLRTNGQILGTKAFTGHSTIYQDGSHGTRVLSILGGYIENQLVGSAPKANYWLLKSEAESSESVSEMDNWMMAAEFADSVGADIITSSLGYNQFDGGVGNYTYSEMDGNTTIVTKAADMAAEKGILVIVSAGNEGSGAWRYITAPADGDSVLAIGAVSDQEIKAGFSSIGPSADGRIKPDLMAMGRNTANSGGVNVTSGNGTSFSCPIISGLAACLWQANLSESNMDIANVLKASAHLANTPNNDYGFGIPNFELAYYTIGSEEAQKSLDIQVFPNPVSDKLSIRVSDDLSSEYATVSISDINGRLVVNESVNLQTGFIHMDFNYPEGMYILRVSIREYSYSQKILK